MDLRGLVVAGRYTIDHEIGRGGMAAVWLAHDAQHSRKVAIKTLHEDLTGAVGAERFLREVRVTAQLQHPGIVPILDSGVLTRPDGSVMPWYAMPFLDGESLRARLVREGQISVDESLRITEAVGGALEYAHRHNVIHRDIKPDNVFLVGDNVYVVDFGIAKAIAATESERLTSTGLSIGTPSYMSPEQALGDSVDARSDQYSLACILYEMLAGEPPFTGPNSQSIIARRLSEPARPLTAVRSSVPDQVERATLRALERTAADRFTSVAAFLAALRATATAQPAARIFRTRVAAFTAALLVIVAVVAFSMSRDDAAPSRAVDPEVEALYRRGVRAHERRTPDGAAEAISALRAALARDSAYAPAWNALAQAYAHSHGRSFRLPGIQSQRLPQLAVEAVERSLLLDSTRADTWTTQSIVRRIIDPTDFGPALDAVRRSIALDSTQPKAWHYLALNLADTGSLDAAIEAWRHVVRLAPRYVESIAFLSLGHYWRADYDSAAFWVDSALRIDPNYLLARSTAGFVAIERREFARAEAAFEAASRVSTDVEVTNALAGLALTKARSGERAEAAIIARRADSLAATYDPIPLHAGVHIAQAYIALGDLDRAFAILDRIQPRRAQHLQLHLKCDPPFAPVWRDRRYTKRLIVPRDTARIGC